MSSKLHVMPTMFINPGITSSNPHLRTDAIRQFQRKTRPIICSRNGRVVVFKTTMSHTALPRKSAVVVAVDKSLDGFWGAGTAQSRDTENIRGSADHSGAGFEGVDFALRHFL